MAKPLFRFTVGPCLQQGLDILAESINRTTEVLGVDNFDWVVCYNGLSRENLDFITKSIKDKPVRLFAQNWADCPVNDHCQSPRRLDGSFEWNGNRCGGTLWKASPPRVRMETHEIVMDNDIILLNKLPEIDEFLSCNNKALILEEPIRFYGRYDMLFGPSEPFLNSGLMGFPPNYDFGKEVYVVWEKHGKYKNISQADEQGLLTYTLNQLPSVRIKKDKMLEILARDFRSKITKDEIGIHFTQANRIPNHRAWKQYQEIYYG